MAKEAFKMDANDIRNLQRELKDTEPNLLNEFRRELKKIAKPVNQQIKANINSQEEIRGMQKIVLSKKNVTVSNNEGRLRWGRQGTRGLITAKAGKSSQADGTSISSSLKSGSRSLTATLLSIRINNPGVAMADMAGRNGPGGRRGMSREYTYRKRNGDIVKRRHKVTTQGAELIAKLGGKPSRYGWSALEARFDDVQREVNKVIETYYKKTNRGR